MTTSFSQWRPHPWHGLDIGLKPPLLVNAYIEITPFDLVKYEIDKNTGYLRVDRPNRTSSLPPTLYGFIPRTYCGDNVKSLMDSAKVGDADPLDICVVSERPIAHAEILLNARVIGGLPMLDGGEADDKIIAVLDKDEIWNDVDDIADLPNSLVNRLIHYFTTYKALPNEQQSTFVGKPYGAKHASIVINAAIKDYQTKFE
ncbi:inorganic pyrophosphatase [Winogradskyella sp.]|uniref:inorganic pyrophosphatase n=1 Tax=Winogradskyella sp. TaxID=1883156 RepID=UPI00262F1087|nr:inorganic pyrophosphatase [Winogradskyella sp.]